MHIDASHDYDSVKTQMAAWFPKLMPNAIICFHDYAAQFPGVMRAVNELPSDFKMIGQAGSVIALRYAPVISDGKPKKLAVCIPLGGAFAHYLPTEFFLSFFDTMIRCRSELKRHNINLWQPFTSAAARPSWFPFYPWRPSITSSCRPASPWPWPIPNTC